MKTELLTKINELSMKKKDFEEKKEKIMAELAAIDEEMKPLKEELLNNMQEENLEEFKNDGLVSVLRHIDTKGYTKEEEVKIIDILKEKGLLSCINVKESLFKKELKKELKLNESLSESLKDYGTTNTTYYVEVLTEENYEKQLKHIEENSGGNK